ncbi:MAG TPA: AI-2E family transporter [Thermoanaerobaculia bacterium]
MTGKTLSRVFFTVLLLGTALVFYKMMAEFLVPVLLAAVFCTLFHPFYLWLTRLLRGRQSAASVLTCLILLLVLLLPLYGVGVLVTHQAIEFYSTAEARVREMVGQGESGPLGTLMRSRWVHDLGLDRVDWSSSLQEGAKGLGAFLVAVLNQASRSTFAVVVLLFLTLFTMFYFFRDGERLVARLRYLIPLEARYQELLIARFAAVSRATVRGTILICLLQGSLAAVTLLIFGVSSWILWGVVTAVLSILPIGGGWLVLYPAALVQLLSGHPGDALGIFLVTTVVVVNVDNIVRPQLMGKGAGMHDLMAFFATLGGIGLFGAMGFIIGPVVAAFFLALLDIYAREMKGQLDELGRDTVEDPASPPASDPEAHAG